MLIAEARDGERGTSRPNPADYEWNDSNALEHRPPAGPNCELDPEIPRFPDMETDQPEYPVADDELEGHVLFDNFHPREERSKKYTEEFLDTMGACKRPRASGCAAECISEQEELDDCLFLEGLKRQTELLRFTPDNGGDEDHEQPGNAASDTSVSYVGDRPPLPARFEDVELHLQATVQRLLEESFNETEVRLGHEQLAFLVRVVAHVQDMLINKLSGTELPQKVFLLLGQGGTGKSEVIKIVTKLVEEYKGILVRDSKGQTVDCAGRCTVAMAGTNAAAVNINGDTIHSSLHFRTNHPLSTLYLAKMEVSQNLRTG